ncbi:helix-turn-helix domain-containing protein [Biomphalaria pfeifferi]|uniref:Helix-turn-helix domain-containing protein n=1 Tax=Biomphalaria pfeifferi TaxID=112525 RepID=A0AAD8ANM8_BIOPF|nr:helix-turn-helix domain-containing protein [Biomphalaria pfeifferi]
MSIATSTNCLKISHVIPVSSFGDRLKEAFGTEQIPEIAKRLNVTYQAAKNYVEGRIPPADKLVEISNSTNCSIHWLLTGNGKPTISKTDEVEKIKIDKLIDFLEEDEIKDIEEFRQLEIEDLNEDVPLNRFLVELLRLGLWSKFKDENEVEIDEQLENINEGDNLNYALRATILRIIRHEITWGKSRDLILDLINKQSAGDNTVPRRNNLNNLVEFKKPKKEKIQDLGMVDKFNIEDAIQKHSTLEDTLQTWYQFEGKTLPEDFSLNFAGWKDLSMEDKIQTVKDVKTFADKMNEKIDKGELEDE